MAASHWPALLQIFAALSLRALRIDPHKYPDRLPNHDSK